VDDESGVLTILTTSRGRHAVAGGDYGSAIRLVRRGLRLVTREALINPAQKGSQRLTKELRSSEQLLARSPSAPARDFASMIDRLLLPPR
jgi:hypothetical protein